MRRSKRNTSKKANYNDMGAVDGSEEPVRSNKRVKKAPAPKREPRQLPDRDAHENTFEDVRNLTRNDLGRFKPTDRFAGCAIIMTDAQGKERVLQFPMPEAPTTPILDKLSEELSEKLPEAVKTYLGQFNLSSLPSSIINDLSKEFEKELAELEKPIMRELKKLLASYAYIPKWETLQNVHPVKQGDYSGYAATTLQGQVVYSTREHFCTDHNGIQYSVLPFGPPYKKDARPFWANPNRVSIYDDEHPEPKEKNKKSNSVRVTPEAVAYRETVERRVPDQKTVMGNISAQEYLKSVINHLEDKVSPQFFERLKRIASVPFKIKPGEKSEFTYRDTQFWNEWLHLIGHGEYPYDPREHANPELGPQYIPNVLQDEYFIISKLSLILLDSESAISGSMF